MNSKGMTLNDFSAELYSKASVPGGGGASAVCGALGSALCGMVINFTTGKAKFAQYEEDYVRMLAESEELRVLLLQLADEDAAAFEPLSKAYSIPKTDVNRDEILEGALHAAAVVPLKIMKAAARAVELHAEAAQKCSMIMISDVGVGALQCKAALLGAYLNVIVNAGLMKDEEFAAELCAESAELAEKYSALASETYEKVLFVLKKW